MSQRRWKPSQRTVSLLFVLATFGFMLFIRHLGWLQFLEFQAYDSMIRHQSRVSSSDPIVLIEMTESDIQSPSLDYPIYDSKLAELLRLLLADGPDCIGLDIWRDVPVPKSGQGLAELNQVLLTNGNICAIFTLAAIKPPPVLNALENKSERIAFNDNFPPDIQVDHTIPKVRRTMLTGNEYFSLPFWLALHFLQTKGVEIEMTPDQLRLGKTTLRKLHRNDGAYVSADDKGFQMLLDFKRPNEFTRFTFTEALSGKIPPGALKDKIIIVGINAPSVEDTRVTPVSGDQRGIEVQAGAVNQLLRIALKGDRPLGTLPDWQEDLWILFWCLVGGLIGYRVHSPWKFVFDSAFCLVVIAATAWLSFMRGLWIPVIAPAMVYLPAAVLITAYITSQERALRANLMNLFSRYASKEIAESYWKHRDQILRGQRPLAQKVTVTILFTDLKGFSTVSETMQPPELYEWLNGYLGTMAEQVLAHGAFLKQFTGDGILALFGVPIPRETVEEQATDARAAVNCALAMGRRLIELSKKWEADGLPKVSMRAGIYTGEVAAGSIGSDERMEYAVIGDVVNTASRLESYDKNFADPDLLPNRCRILIGESTHALLDATFVSKQIGLLEVKGKVNKVSVFQILDPHLTNPPASI